MSSVRQLLVNAEIRLQQAGVPSPRVDTEVLLAHVLKVTRSQLLIQDEITQDAKHEFELLIRRRQLREPLSYITNEAPFRRIVLSVGPGVLIPRPETELIVDIVKRSELSGNVVDLGCGSGAIGLSIATEIKNCQVLGIDNSEQALHFTKINSEQLTPKFLEGSSFDARLTSITEVPVLFPNLVGKTQIVVANPPYVPEGSRVADEVRYHEPAVAVFADKSGYSVIDQVISTAALLLAPGGLLVIEHSELHGPKSQDGGVWRRLTNHQDQFGQSIFENLLAVDDLTGRPRFTAANRKQN